MFQRKWRQVRITYTKRCTAEFKRDAIALVGSSGKTVTAVAWELGISSESSRVWYHRAKADRGESAPGELTTAEREELERLRKRATEQVKTIGVLRRAAVFFFTGRPLTPGSPQQTPPKMPATMPTPPCATPCSPSLTGRAPDSARPPTGSRSPSISCTPGAGACTNPPWLLQPQALIDRFSGSAMRRGAGRANKGGRKRGGPAG
ncbi:hypothetical protein GCM10010329_61640 [Streptomyces spiroverticillatus]|uniref:Transposase n=1 Tax=Streptomyces finlayi TaxID=67296 RepID=A0A918X6B0_9ACTN|nr:hypothetical protein GCM10010329_61640 [Streptomyces spiroverticillatus]GHD15087.1 hypothetical protein GCM10010334_74810 [Streptomyces finlayi]